MFILISLYQQDARHYLEGFIDTKDILWCEEARQTDKNGKTKKYAIIHTTRGEVLSSYSAGHIFYLMKEEAKEHKGE